MKLYQITVREKEEFDLTRIYSSGHRTSYDCRLFFESDNFHNR